MGETDLVSTTVACKILHPFENRVLDPWKAVIKVYCSKKHSIRKFTAELLKKAVFFLACPRKTDSADFTDFR